jgi:hypothetical protein
MSSELSKKERDLASPRMNDINLHVTIACWEPISRPWLTR